MQFFSNCYTIHDAKKRFRELAKIHHPDAGGDSKTMSEVIRQYDNFIPSRQPHSNSYEQTNFFKSTGYRFNTTKRADTQEFFRRYSENLKNTHAPQNRFTSRNFESIPFDHPVMEELRELRSKNNYAIQEENKWLKGQNERFSREIERLKSSHEKNLDRLKKIIKKLKGEPEIKKEKKTKLRRKKSSES